jgi:hypothetical protein
LPNDPLRVCVIRSLAGTGRSLSAVPRHPRTSTLSTTVRSSVRTTRCAVTRARSSGGRSFCAASSPARHRSSPSRRLLAGLGGQGDKHPKSCAGRHPTIPVCEACQQTCQIPAAAGPSRKRAKWVWREIIFRWHHHVVNIIILWRTSRDFDDGHDHTYAQPHTSRFTVLTAALLA